MSPLYTYLAQYLRFQIAKENKLEMDFSKPEAQFQYESADVLADFVIENDLSEIDLVCLLLALVPHVQPHFLSRIVSEFFPEGGEFPEFGGCNGKQHRGIIPTGETAVYVLAGTDLRKRMEVKKYLSGQSPLFEKGILYFESVPTGEPPLSGKLLLDEEFSEWFCTGVHLRPKQGPGFPAQYLQTELNWEDLVLNESTLNEIKEIETWLKYNERLMNEFGMKGIVKPGFRVMFYGPSGTGKTLAASLLGKYTDRDVYRIDLSLVVSKYIGETEKNLASLFDKAANKNWILFFDEADAIFGKRTGVRDAHDKYANQEVSYLLQRIEAHPGLIILASNFKSNIDAAFTRRFQSIVEFDLPGHRERLLLWKSNLPKNIHLDSQINLEEISRKYELSGANIVNIIQYICLKQMEHKSPTIQLEHLLNGIKREYTKEGKLISGF